MTTVTLLGTGLMGKPMAHNLAKHGHKLHVWNRTIKKAEMLSPIATVHNSAIEAVKNTDVVISMLADGPTTIEVLQNNKVIESAPKHCLFINMASSEPETDIALAKLTESMNKRFLDAPVSGGVKGAEEGTLTIFVGGYSTDYEEAQPILAALGHTTLMGPHGTGQITKLANQLIVGITIGAVAEAFKLAESGGCDPKLLRKALGGGFADSKILDLHGERMITANYQAGGKCSTQLKDMNNIINFAARYNLDLPLSKVAKSSYDSLVNKYDSGDLDHAAYYLWLQKINDNSATT